MPLYNEKILLKEIKNTIIEEKIPLVETFTINDVFNSQIEGKFSTLNIPVVEHIKEDLSYLYVFNLNQKSASLPIPIIFDPLDVSSLFISKIFKSQIVYLTQTAEYEVSGEKFKESTLNTLIKSIGEGTSVILKDPDTTLLSLIEELIVWKN